MASSAHGTARRGFWLDEATKLIALSGPIILTNLGNIVIQTTDVVMIGWLGSSELAASALSTNVRFFMFLFSVGVLAAISPMMAQIRGVRAYAVRDIRRTVRQGLWVCFVIGLPVCMLLWRIDLVLAGLRQAPELIELALPYTQAAVFGFLPALGFMVLRNFIAALERPQAAMIISIIGILFNALANYVLIFGAFGLPAFGLVGAGVATSLTECFLFFSLLLVIFVNRRFRRYHVFGRFWRPDWERFFEVWRLGLPIGISLVMEVSLFAGAGFLMGWIGTTELAAHQIALQCAAVTFMVPLGFGQAATVRVGLAAGRCDAAGVYLAGTTALCLGIVFMAAMALVLLTFPESIVAIFLDEAVPSSADVASLAATFLIFAAIFQVFDGAQVIGMGVLRGMKDTRWPMVFAAIAYAVIGLPASIGLAFGVGYGGYGIWAGLITGLIAAAGLLLTRFILLQRSLAEAWARHR
ncbi:MAG: MATE family efflux transporter [Pseudomonadota bacterium]